MEEKRRKRRMWQSPWGVPESVAVVCGIVLVGFFLQLVIGGFDFFLLASPANLFFGGAIILLCIATAYFRKNIFFKWFSGIPFSVSLIMALLVLSIIMGLTPQTVGNNVNDNSNIFLRLGFDQMTSSWAFVLIYFTILLSLGALIVRRLGRFKLKDYGFYLNHIGLWLVLFAAGLGYADLERYIMHVREGETEWRVYDDAGNVKELPIAIQLNDFDMEEYPPKLTIIDRGTGEPQPTVNPDFYQIDTRNIYGNLNGWQIEIEEYIHQAIRNSDSTYREVPMPGATPAARVRAQNKKTGAKHTGWVCGGNQAQLYMTLPLDEQFSVVMTQTEPKRFMSDVDIYVPYKKAPQKALIEVNKPAQVGSWTIYQYGYENAAGRLSSYSSMELVYDPWKIPIYIGFGLIALGSLFMIWNGKQLRRYDEENE